ncbi:MAG: AarF/UbiB family protein [Parachlamydiaceae bacterium]
MNPFNFFRLIRTLYGKGLPDVDFIQSQGLLAVKIGQVYALRPDFLSEEKCRELTKLYRHVDEVKPAALDILVKNAFGDGSQFLSFDKKPIASASVGQVHKAVLKTGETVAVKLIKADVAQQFRKDVKSVQRLFKIAIFFYPKLKGVANPAELIGQIEKMTLSELNLKNEIEGYRRLQEVVDVHKEQIGPTSLGFAHVYEALSSENALVMDYINGKTMDELLDEKALSYPQLLEFFRIQGLFTYLGGVFHGDIHPGNIIISNNKFYFVDAGYIGKVGEKIKVNLLNFFDHLSQYDYPQAAFFLNKMSDIEIKGEAYESFEKKFIELYADFRGKPVGEMSLTKKMMQTIRLGVLSGMSFGEGMFDIIKSHMYLDGMAIRCNPKAIILEDMRPFIREYKTLL